MFSALRIGRYECFLNPCQWRHQFLLCPPGAPQIKFGKIPSFKINVTCAPSNFYIKMLCPPLQNSWRRHCKWLRPQAVHHCVSHVHGFETRLTSWVFSGYSGFLPLHSSHLCVSCVPFIVYMFVSSLYDLSC